MINHNEINSLIDKFTEEVKNIKFEKTTADDNNYSNLPFTVPLNNNYHYVDNSWNTTIINSNTTSNISTGSTKSDSKTGNNPLIFLMATGALAIGATYLIATDDYRKLNKKFTNLDDLLKKIEDKTKNTFLENNSCQLKENYEKFKNKLEKKYYPSYYSKWGIICSSLVLLTYLYPFGMAALVPGIFGLVFSGCYWLWNIFTFDEFNIIIETHKDLKKILSNFKNETSGQPHEYKNNVDSYNPNFIY